MTFGATPVPVIVLTGFLGAGKTTLLNGLLRDAGMAGTAVLINEFGETGIDHLLVERVDGDMVMLTTGCLCCAARGDLITALSGLFQRRAQGLVRFERIVIETTGLADPGPVINALLPSAELGDVCRLDRVVTVVNASADARRFEASEDAARQVALADVLVLSKIDLLAAEDFAPVLVLEDRLRQLNPTASILRTSEPGRVLAALRDMVPPVEPRSGHPHRHRHLDGIEAVSLRAGMIEPLVFERFVDRVISRHGANLLRLKGLVASAADPLHPVVVNVVQHRVHPPVRLQRWPNDDHETRLAVIAQAGSAAAIADLWASFFGPPLIDTPDAAALSLGLEAGPGLF